MSLSAALPAPMSLALFRDRVLRPIAAVTAVGLALGFLVGGIGSRIAMRLLFLTSNPAVKGMTSDDGFAIGQFSAGATANLLLVTTGIGVIGAFVYVAVRPFLMGPRWLRYTGCAVAGGLVIGSQLVHTRGVDFTLLSPRWFAIALFVALPALFAVLVAPAVDRALRPDGWFAMAPPSAALLPLLVFLFPPLLVLVGVPAVVVSLVRERLPQMPRLRAAVCHPATMWTARGAWVAIALLGTADLVRDVRVLL